MKTLSRLVIAFYAMISLCAFASMASAQGFKEEPLVPLAEHQQLVNLKLVPYSPTSTYEARRIAWPGDLATVAGEIEGVYKAEGLSINWKTDDDLVNQVREMIQGKLHFLRLTMGQAVQAAPLFGRLGTDLVVVVQLTWSTGGDMIVGYAEIKSLDDINEIAMMLYGPHPELYAKLMTNASKDLSSVKIHWFKGLTYGDPDSSGKFTDVPNAFAAGIKVATVISPDAATLMSAEGKTGTHVLASSKDAPFITADVFCVRGDFFDANREVCRKFFRATVKSEEAIYEANASRAQQPKRFNSIMEKGAPAVFQVPDPSVAADSLPDCTFAFGGGNRYFFTGKNPDGTINFRTGKNLVKEISESFTVMGLLPRGAKVPIRFADWDFGADQQGFKYPNMVAGVKFDVEKTSAAITAQVASETGSIDDLLSQATRSIQFEPNQNEFDGEAYIAAYEDLIRLAADNAGTPINVQGLADSTSALYFEQYGDPSQKAKVPSMKKDLENDSYQRASKVLAAAFAYWDSKGYSYNPKQFVVTGAGGNVWQVDPRSVLPAMAEAVRIGRDGNKVRAQQILDTQVKAVIAPNRVVLFRVQRIDSETSSIEALLDGK